jgi:hypothetical protein
MYIMEKQRGTKIMKEYHDTYQIKEIVIETLKGAQNFLNKYDKHIKEWDMDYADAYEMEDILEAL